ncbi:MAG: phosphoglycerate mutase, partial [Candidatus Sumerlaeia bacterium]|nr:phosphoglycerate mutase [Candidatus Sumerlaeia bacterium]
VFILPVKDYRFALVLRGKNLSCEITDTDPQKVGKKPLDPQPSADTPSARHTAQLVKKILDKMFAILAHEPDANAALVRGFSKDPCLPKMQELYKLTPAAIATYPLYRGVAKLIGMDVYRPQDETIEAEFELLHKIYHKYDFFFIHIKKTDSYGEDGNPEGKIKVIEETDRALPKLLELKPDVIVVTGDHSTPTQWKAHSWHPVPLMIYSPYCDMDDVREFSERACDHGSLGIIPATEIMPLALANAGKLLKYGA